MKIWLINQYNMPPEYGHLNRHFNFGKYLKKQGHEPTVFVGSFLHNSKNQMIVEDVLIKKYENVDYPYYFIKTCDYSSSKIKRVYAMYEFYKNLLKAVKSFDKPDVILGSSAHPFAAIAAIKLAKRFDCQSIVEVRDLWPESFIAYGLVSKKNPLLRLLYAGEKWIYKNADKLVFTMEGGKDYIIDQKWDSKNGGPVNLEKVFHINNGVDLSVFNENRDYHEVTDADLEDDEYFKVVYIGSIRLVNRLDMILDVAKLLVDKKVKFLLWGDGDYLKYLKDRVKKEKISNVIFKGVTDKKFIPSIISKSDLNIIVGENKPLFRYGLSANKIFDYMASGKPTLATFKTNYSLLDKYNNGIDLEDNSILGISQAIEKFMSMSPNEYDKYCLNAIKASMDYDFTKLTSKLVEVINKEKCK